MRGSGLYAVTDIKELRKELSSEVSIGYREEKIFGLLNDGCFKFYRRTARIDNTRRSMMKTLQSLIT